jgi:hypothetical protein
MLPVKYLIWVAATLELKGTVKGLSLLVFGIIVALFGRLMPQPFDIIFYTLGTFGIAAGLVTAILRSD